MSDRKLKNSQLPRFVKQSNAAYHADFTAVGRSMLFDFTKRRRLYEGRYITGDAPKKNGTREMDLGTLAHAGLLEPEHLDQRYAVYPDSVLSKDGKASTSAASAFKAENEAAGRLVLKQADFDLVRRMVDSVMAKLQGWVALKSRREECVYWNNPETDLRCKCMLDWLILAGGVAYILDFKTTADCSPDKFRYSCEDYGYWLQDPHYGEGVSLVTGLPVQFLFVVVESKYPHETSVQRLSPRDAGQAAAARLTHLRELKHCLDTGDFSEPWESTVSEISLRPSCYA